LPLSKKIKKKKMLTDMFSSASSHHTSHNWQQDSERIGEESRVSPWLPRWARRTIADDVLLRSPGASQTGGSHRAQAQRPRATKEEEEEEEEMQRPRATEEEEEEEEEMQHSHAMEEEEREKKNEDGEEEDIFKGAIIQPIKVGSMQVPLVTNFYDLFTVERELGKGTFGKTLLVQRIDTGKQYALKILHKADPEILHAEVKILQHMGCISPRVICYRDTLAVPSPSGRPALAVLSDYVPGQTLHERLKARGGYLPPSEALLLIAELLAVIAIIHSAGYAHRDIKLNNAIVTPDERVVLVDFGLSCAQRADDAPSSMSKRGESGLTCSLRDLKLGTPLYMAPELLDPSSRWKWTKLKDITQLYQKADIFAAGVVAYELLSGRSPTFLRLQFPRYVSQYQPVRGVGPCINALIKTMLDPYPFNRPTASGALDMLCKCARTIPTCNAPDVTALLSSEPTSPRRRSRRRPSSLTRRKPSSARSNSSSRQARVPGACACRGAQTQQAGSPALQAPSLSPLLAHAIF
jgi:serine/threonine protein kinase